MSVPHIVWDAFLFIFVVDNISSMRSSIIIIIGSAIATLLLLMVFWPEDKRDIDQAMGWDKPVEESQIFGFASCMKMHTIQYTVSRVLMMKEDPNELIPGKRRVAIPLTFTLTGYIDLNKLDMSNVTFSKGRYTVSLPEAEVEIIGHEGDRVERVSWNRMSIKDEEIEGELARIKREVYAQYVDEVRQRAKKEFEVAIMPYFERLQISDKVDIVTLPNKDR